MILDYDESNGKKPLVNEEEVFYSRSYMNVF